MPYCNARTELNQDANRTQDASLIFFADEIAWFGFGLCHLLLAGHWGSKPTAPTRASGQPPRAAKPSMGVGPGKLSPANPTPLGALGNWRVPEQRSCMGTGLRCGKGEGGAVAPSSRGPAAARSPTLGRRISGIREIRHSQRCCRERWRMRCRGRGRAAELLANGGLRRKRKLRFKPIAPSKFFCAWHEQHATAAQRNRTPPRVRRAAGDLRAAMAEA
jgi:hypothetical protein